MFKLGDEHESDDNEKPNSALQMVFKTNTNRANRTNSPVGSVAGD